MLNNVNNIVAEAIQPYADARIHHCQVEVTFSEPGHCVLSGTVLDSATREGLAAALAVRLPDMVVDLSGVEVLRRPWPVMRAVGTNLTGLYGRPSFGSELVSQLFNGAPLEVLRQEDRWAFVRQSDGYLGWVYGPYLTGPVSTPATHLVVAPVSPLRTEPQFFSSLVGRVLGGTGVVVVRIELFGNRVSDGWAQVNLAGGQIGWMSLMDLRPVADLPTDEATRRQQIVAYAHSYKGVPYQWGGSSGMGIDCSGLAQLTHRLVGVTLPRDADMQFDAGRPAQEPFQPGDLLFFASGSETRRITHVGISLGGWQIIHASRAQNGVYTDDVQAVEHLRNTFVGARSFLQV